MALTIDTTAKRVEQGSTAIPTTGSLQVWIFPTWAQTDGLQHTIIGTYNGSGTIDFDIQKFTDNKLYAGWNTVGVTDSRVIVPSASYTLNQNAWNHIVLTWTSGGTCTLYLNGTSIGTSSTISTFSTAGRIRVIGNDNTHSAGTLGGRVAEYAIWNKVLSSAEVTALYNSGANAQLASQQENASLVDYCPLWGILTTDVNLVSSGTNPSLVGSPAQSAHAPVVIFPVQTSTTQSAGSSINLSFGSTPTVNNAILVKFFVRTTGSINTPTCTDNQGNTYTLSYSQVDTTNKNWVFEFLGKAATSSGTFTVTAGFTTVSGTNIIDVEINEIHPALFLDKKSTNTGTSTSPTPGSVSTTVAQELLSTGFVDDGTGTTAITVPSGYLLTSSDVAGTTKVRDGSALGTAGVTGSFNPTWTTASADWACGQATYSTTAIASGVPSPQVTSGANEDIFSPARYVGGEAILFGGRPSVGVTPPTPNQPIVMSVGGGFLNKGQGAAAEDLISQVRGVSGEAFILGGLPNKAVTPPTPRQPVVAAGGGMFLWMGQGAEGEDQLSPARMAGGEAIILGGRANKPVTPRSLRQPIIVLGPTDSYEGATLLLKPTTPPASAPKPPTIPIINVAEDYTPLIPPPSIILHSQVGLPVTPRSLRQPIINSAEDYTPLVPPPSIILHSQVGLPVTPRSLRQVVISAGQWEPDPGSAVVMRATPGRVIPPPMQVAVYQGPQESESGSAVVMRSTPQLPSHRPTAVAFYMGDDWIQETGTGRGAVVVAGPIRVPPTPLPPITMQDKYTPVVSITGVAGG